MVVVQLGNIVFAEEEVPGGGLIQTAQQVQQRTFARARRPHDGNVVAFRNLQRDALEHRQGFPGQVVAFGDVVEPDCRRHARSARDAARQRVASANWGGFPLPPARVADGSDFLATLGRESLPS